MEILAVSQASLLSNSATMEIGPFIKTTIKMYFIVGPFLGCLLLLVTHGMDVKR